MFKVGKNITINADQVLEFRGLNDAGEELKIGQIKGSIKDNKKGQDQSVITIIGRKDGQHKPLLTVDNNAIYAPHNVTLCLPHTGRTTTCLSGKSSTKRHIDLPDDNDELMINNRGKIMATDLPTTDPGNNGQLWNDNGTVKISAG